MHLNELFSKLKFLSINFKVKLEEAFWGNPENHCLHIFFYNPAIHPTCLSPLFFSVLKQSFFGAFKFQRRTVNSDSPQIQANFYSVLFCVFIHRQCLLILPLPPTYTVPSGPAITMFSHLAKSLTEFWVAGIDQTSIQMVLSKMAPT